MLHTYILLLPVAFAMNCSTAHDIYQQNCCGKNESDVFATLEYEDELQITTIQGRVASNDDFNVVANSASLVTDDLESEVTITVTTDSEEQSGRRLSSDYTEKDIIFQIQSTQENITNITRARIVCLLDFAHYTNSSDLLASQCNKRNRWNSTQDFNNLEDLPSKNNLLSIHSSVNDKIKFRRKRINCEVDTPPPHPPSLPFPPDTQICCMALIPSCLACQAGITTEEWCRLNLNHTASTFCPPPRPQWKLPKPPPPPPSPMPPHSLGDFTGISLPHIIQPQIGCFQMNRYIECCKSTSWSVYCKSRQRFSCMFTNDKCRFIRM